MVQPVHATKSLDLLLYRSSSCSSSSRRTRLTFNFSLSSNLSIFQPEFLPDLFYQLRAFSMQLTSMPKQELLVAVESMSEGAKASLSLSGTMLGFYPVRVLPSKMAIALVDLRYLPRVLSIPPSDVKIKEEKQANDV